MFREKAVTGRRQKSQDEPTPRDKGKSADEVREAKLSVNGRRFGDVLIEAGVIAAEDLESALRR